MRRSFSVQFYLGFACVFWGSEFAFHSHRLASLVPVAIGFFFSYGLALMGLALIGTRVSDPAGKE
jgi:hypothetical protein